MGCPLFLKSVKVSWKISMLKLAGGRLKYPSKSVEIGNITVDASLSKPEGIMDSLKLSVSKLEAVIAGHPLLANFSVITHISNPTLAGQIIGELDFSALKQAIPVDSMEIGGLARANIKFSGPSNAIEKGEYDSFQTSGDLTLQDFFYRSPLFPDRLGIQSARYDFISSPRWSGFFFRSGSSNRQSFWLKKP